MNFFNFLLCVFKFTSEYLIKNWIALIALFLSYSNYRRNNLQVELIAAPVSDWILSVILDNGENIYNPNGTLRANIKIINPSNVDVSYFDLIVFDKNRKYQHYYQKQNNIINDLTGREAIAAVQPDGNTILIEVPEADCGVLKAHSMTRMDLIIQTSEITDRLFVAFKVAKKKKLFKANKAGYVNSPYKSFSASFPVELSKKPHYEDILKDLHE
ncbi:TPA: hypothetical protein ACIZJJ_002095 [Streptococcus agalactiae]